MQPRFLNVWIFESPLKPATSKTSPQAPGWESTPGLSDLQMNESLSPESISLYYTFSRPFDSGFDFLLLILEIRHSR